MSRCSRKTPPTSETTANHAGPPCLHEQFSQGALSAGGGPGIGVTAYCLRRDLCDSTSGWLSQIINLAYDEKIATTLSEPSSSIISRSESHFHHGEHSRLSVRKHLHEVDSGERATCRGLTPALVKAIINDVQRFVRFSSFARNLAKPQQPHEVLKDWLEHLPPTPPATDYDRR